MTDLTMRYSFLLICCLLIISGCTLINEPEKIPAYIQIDAVELSVKVGQGANTQNFKDIWVYVNGESIGAYELPAVVPVIFDDNEVDLSFQAGIRVNGTASNPNYYPFTTVYETTISLKANDTIQIDPVFEYISGTLVAFNESFESDHGFVLDVDGDTSTYLIRTGLDASSGSYSGFMSIEGDTVMEVGAEYLVEDFPENGSSVYLELDYKSNVIFDIALIGYNAQSSDKYYFLAINPKENWNRIYIDMTRILIDSGFDSYRFVVGVSNIGYDYPAALYIDNVKFLYFN